MKIPPGLKQWEAEHGYPIVDEWWEKDNYKHLCGLSAKEWAWEFLRRNPEYQGCWEIFKEFPDRLVYPDGSTSNKNGKWKGTPPDGETRFFVDNHAKDDCYFWADPPPRYGESVEEYRDRCEDGEIYVFSDFIETKFRISHPVDPRDDLPPWVCISGPDYAPPFPLHSLKMVDYGGYLSISHLFRDHSLEDSVVWGYPANRSGDDDAPLYRMAIEFDLRYDIGRQLDAARDELELFREHRMETAATEFQPIKKSSVQGATYPLYVRLLDAELAGASPKEIRDVIFPDNENEDLDGNLRKQRRKAKSLSAGGYIDIPALPAAKDR